MNHRGGKRRIGRRIALAAVGILGVGLIVFVAGWLAFRAVPSWYVPVDVSREELSRVRNNLPNTYQALKDGVLRRKPFTFTLTGHQVTEWIVAREELYPDAGEWLPDWLYDPVVVFDDGECILSARIDYRGWQTILGVRLSAHVMGDDIRLRVAGVTAGVLPIPLSFLDKPIGRFLADDRLDAEYMPDPVAALVRKLQSAGAGGLLSKGILWKNRFELRDAPQDLRIVSLSAKGGQLHIQFEPR